MFSNPLQDAGLFDGYVVLAKMKDLAHIKSDCDEFSSKYTYPYSSAVLRFMNLPFAYNVPRFKNLSYQKFFDKQRLEALEKNLNI
ncbi:hypothetical protein [uncultured Ruminococcus sp.]|uniref:hypothetical protein n=1 Tax=uncultured Ruminococcus sp. TaxID=165186 RepID=UPI002584A554|nr:hypothetical protein [uncultured Ruminococcus sp.]